MQSKVINLRNVLKSRSGKLFFTFWTSSVLCLFGLTVYGIFEKDFFNSTIIGVLVAAPFADLAIIASYWSDQSSRLIAKITWLLWAIILLLAAVALLEQGNSEIDLIIAYISAILAFPLGILMAPLAGQVSLPAGLPSTIFVWVILIGSGFIQWFSLIPLLLKAIENSKADRSSLD